MRYLSIQIEESIGRIDCNDCIHCIDGVDNIDRIDPIDWASLFLFKSNVLISLPLPVRTSTSGHFSFKFYTNLLLREETLSEIENYHLRGLSCQMGEL